jgi:ribosomal protein L16/L10AE
MLEVLEAARLTLMRQLQRRKGVKVQTKTYTTEKEAKKAAARDYRPAIVRLPNGRYACFQAGDALPQGARAVSRWGTDRWHAFE